MPANRNQCQSRESPQHQQQDGHDDFAGTHDVYLLRLGLRVKRVEFVKQIGILVEELQVAYSRG